MVDSDDGSDVVSTVTEHVALVELNAPERLNAMKLATIARLRELYLRFDADPAVRVIVITGRGRGFCTGADVGDLVDKAEQARAGRGVQVEQSMGDRRVADTGFTPRRCGVFKPTIVAVNGVCNAAGLHFLADADIAIAAESATFLDTHTTLGQVTTLEPIILARTGIPLNAILRMVVLGRNERIDADAALRIGLVSEIVADADLLGRALDLAALAAQASPAALQRSLRAIWGSFDQTLSEAYEAGHALIWSHRSHPDAIEGASSFGEKRTPVWADE